MRIKKTSENSSGDCKVNDKLEDLSVDLSGREDQKGSSLEPSRGIQRHGAKDNDVTKRQNFSPGIRVIETVMFAYDYNQVLTNVIGIETMSAEARALLVQLLGLVYQTTMNREIEGLFYDLNQQSYWPIVQELDTYKYVSVIQKENEAHHTLIVCDGPKCDVVDLDGSRFDPTFDTYEQEGFC